LDVLSKVTAIENRVNLHQQAP